MIMLVLDRPGNLVSTLIDWLVIVSKRRKKLKKKKVYRCDVDDSLPIDQTNWSSDAVDWASYQTFKCLVVLYIIFRLMDVELWRRCPPCRPKDTSINSLFVVLLVLFGSSLSVVSSISLYITLKKTSPVPFVWKLLRTTPRILANCVVKIRLFSLFASWL